MYVVYIYEKYTMYIGIRIHSVHKIVKHGQVVKDRYGFLFRFITCRC